MRKKISVTKDHIDRGLRFEPKWCPIAIAMGEAGLKDPCVKSPISFILNESDQRFFSPMPESASRFVGRFDRRGHGSVRPFNFFINVPDVEVKP